MFFPYFFLLLPFLAMLCLMISLPWRRRLAELIKKYIISVLISICLSFSVSLLLLFFFKCDFFLSFFAVCLEFECFLLMAHVNYRACKRCFVSYCWVWVVVNGEISTIKAQICEIIIKFDMIPCCSTVDTIYIPKVLSAITLRNRNIFHVLILSPSLCINTI